MDRVLLFSLPWATPLEPSLGISLLKAVYNDAGIPCDVYETQLEMYRWVTHGTYVDLARSWGLTDFIFTEGFEDEPSPRQLQIAEEICAGYDLRGPGAPALGGPNREERMKIVLEMRQTVAPRFLDAVLENVDLSRYCLIGFTCLFDQTFASLALAKRIRQLRPDVMLAYGGYALQAPVGPHLQAVFPELMTAVAYGDGEPVAVPLYRAAMGELPLDEVPNLSITDGEGKIAFTDPQQCDLNQTPTPDFGDFFRHREEMSARHKIRIRVPTLPLESSRGCWWGQKSHCVFCGIDDDTMRYRERLPANVIRDMAELYERHGAANFRFSDYILPHRYYKTLLPELAELAGPYRLQYEAKANMKVEHFDLLKEAGVFWVQLGVESFSTPVLKRMKKGVTGLQNIHSIRALMQRGIKPYYNVLYGFPGDVAADYQSMIELFPALFHLKAPGQCIWVQITRFAPLAERPEEFGYSGTLQHHWRYEVMFSDDFLDRSELELASVCYSFESYNEDLIAAEVKSLYQILQEQWWQWRSRESSGSRLSFRLEEDGICFTDSRARDKPKELSFGPLHREIYRRVDVEIRRESEVVGAIPGVSEESARAALDDLLRCQVVISEGPRYLGLALHESIYEGGKFWWEDGDTWEGFLE